MRLAAFRDLYTFYNNESAIKNPRWAALAA
jgi:hypothetical protein